MDVYQKCRYTCRCYLSVQEMQALGLSFLDPVIVVDADKQMFLCSVRPWQNPLPGIFDPLMQLNGASEEINQVLNGPSQRVKIHKSQKQLESVTLYAIQQEVANASTITVEIQNSNVRISQQNIVFYRKWITQLLQHQVVSSQSYFSLPSDPLDTENNDTVFDFKIIRTTPAQPMVRVIRSTRIFVLFTTKPSSLVRREARTKIVFGLSYPSLGGLQPVLDQLYDVLVLPLLYGPTLTGFDFPKGILLHGPPGTGKTMVVRKVLEYLESGKLSNGARLPVKFISINGPDVLGAPGNGIGQVEKALRDVFRQGQEHVEKNKANHGICVIFMDEIESLCPRRETSSTTQARTVAQMLTLLDGIEARGNLIVLAATNLPNSIDTALRRPGRFDREIQVSAPNQRDRETILMKHAAHMPTVDVDFKKIAALSIGYVGADLVALCREAALLAMMEISALDANAINHRPILLSDRLLAISYLTIPSRCSWASMLNCDMGRGLLRLSQIVRTNDKQRSATEPVIRMAHFIRAMELVGASSLRGQIHGQGGNMHWDDIGGQHEAKLRLRQIVEWPLKYPHTFQRLGLKSPRGVLVHGPPGCSKTSLVKAAATGAQATFLYLSAADVYSPYFGEAEAAIRQIFRQARAAIPSIIFLDEIDAIVTKRDLTGSGGDSGSSTSTRVLSTLLNEMDGVESSEGLLIVGATNRVDMIDKALLRPGRFDRVLQIDLPTAQDRLEILRIHTRNIPLEASVNLQAIAENTDSYSGAELENLCREAAMDSLRTCIDCPAVSNHNFESVLRQKAT